MPIPYTSRSKAFNSQLRGTDIEAELDRLYADANDLLSQVENVLGLNGNVTSEVLAARKGQPNLLAEIDRLEAIKAEVEAARHSANQGGAFASLDARLEAIDTRITSALSAVQGAAEVVEGRTDSAGKVHAAIRDAINKGSKILEGLSLAAINQIAMSSTAIVDAFVYDPSRDSDGGAWRERCQHTSWFNETLQIGRWLGTYANEAAARAAGGTAGDYYYSTDSSGFRGLIGSSGQAVVTRGKTAKFPGPVLILATTTAITIYDATDPTLPMWKSVTFTGSAIFALNGSIIVASAGNGLFIYSLAGDFSHRYANTGNARLPGVFVPVPASSITGGAAIVNNSVNDVAATVLPGAPTDPATGLPVPTVAVATAGGVSVIKHDGTIANLTTDMGNDMRRIAIHRGEVFFAPYIPSATQKMWHAKLDGIGTKTYTAADHYYNSGTSIPSILNQYLDSEKVSTGKALVSSSYFAQNGISVLYDNPADPTKGLVAYVTKDYTSGILPGDIRRAWLASGTAETIAGAELVTNGTFNTDLSGWTLTGTNGGTNNVTWDAAGKARMVCDGTSAVEIRQTGILSFGKRYVAQITVSDLVSGSIKFYSGSEHAASLGSGTHTIHFTADSADIRIIRNSGVTDLKIDNVSVRLADPDRSVKNKGLGVYGSLVKSSVAVGSDLMGYSGFSALNYLEEPYSADLDFGTGDFIIFGWLKENPNSVSEAVFSRAAHSGSWTGGGYIHIAVKVDGTLEGMISDDSRASVDTITSTAAVDDSTWKQAKLVRRGGVLELWVNGVKAASDVTITAATATLNNASATARIGYRQDGGLGSFNGSLALWRVAAFAPSPEQIRMIYEYERHLFTDNAKCLLGGTSNAVQALDYDPETGILLVGTANGVSLFQGLRRINHLAAAPLTNTNMKAVAGINGAILMAGGAEAVFQAPQRNIREEVERVKRRFVVQQPRTAWFTSAASQVDFDLPTRASRILGVTVAGALAREASGAAANRYQVLDYGFKQTVRLGATPTTGSDVAIEYIEEV
jgi:hypothetical protein